MDDHTVAEITDWSADAFSEGFDGLHRLAERSFTGAVESGGAYLFFVKGAPVEVADGTIEGFEGASGTAYEAPHPSLPLLFAMQSRGGETRGRYYTEDTPVMEVDSTLAEGGFTGYLELSENVLSGDYYAVYQGGRSMRLAFVGQARRVLTDAEAWEKTRNEVGIYEVTAVSLDVIDIPGEPPSAAGGDTAVGAGTAPGGQAGSTSGHAGENLSDAETEPTGEPAVEEPPERDADAPSPDRTADPRDADVSTPGPDGDDETAQADDTDLGVRPGDPGDIDAAGTRPDEDDDTREEGDRTLPADEPAGAADDDVTGVTSVDSEAGADTDGDAPSEPVERSPGPDDATVDLDEEDAEVEERGEELAEAKRRIDELRNRRDDLERQLAQVREERDELRAELERLGGAGGPPERRMSPSEVLQGTTLFLRYDSKAKTTLADVGAGEGEESGLRSNLRIEHHTTFDDEGVVVDGEPVSEFLADTQAYRFLRWLATGLFFEIRATGHTDRLSTLYEAIPAIDRAELGRALTVTDPGDGSEREVTFDLVARDKTGQPLLVADLNEERDPVGQPELVELVETAEAACRTGDSLAAAFSVATSYFDSDALGTAREATSGSLLSRDSRPSFVKLSRKRGFYLGLVEDREHTFHLAVPDL